MEAVIFIGIQAAGKSTFYQRHFFTTHIRLSMDMLRTRHRESILFEACLLSKQPFVIDNTNPMAADRERYIPAAKNHRFRVVGYYFQASIEDVLRRNAQRSGKALVPDLAIRATYRRLEIPSVAEGFDVLYQVESGENGNFIVKEMTSQT